MISGGFEGKYFIASYSFGVETPKQLQRTAKPTAFCEIYRVFGKGVVKSGILKIRGCSGRKQRKAKDLRGVVR